MHKKIYIKKMTINNEPVRLELKSIPVQIKVIDEAEGIIEAYVSVFGNVDSYGDVVLKGAFKRAVEEFNADGRFPKGVWHHDWMQPISKTLEMREDERGLLIKGKLILKVQKAAEVYELIKEGVITDFSFGYSVRDYDYDAQKGIRYIKDIEIYEWSPVLVGANNMATLVGVKNAGVEVEEVDKTEIVPEANDTDPEPTPGEDAGDPPASETPAPEGQTDEPKSEEAAEEQTPTPPTEDPKPNGEDPAPETPSEQGKTKQGDEEKAGRVLSKKNEQIIKDAMVALKSTLKMFEELISSLEQPDDEDDEKAASASRQSARSGGEDPNLIKGLKIAAKQAINGGQAMIVHIKKLEGKK